MELPASSLPNKETRNLFELNRCILPRGRSPVLWDQSMYLRLLFLGSWLRVLSFCLALWEYRYDIVLSNGQMCNCLSQQSGLGMTSTDVKSC